MRSPKILFSTIALAAALFAPLAADAQLKTAATARIKQLNKMAMENYDSLEFEKAKTQLLEALKVAKQTAVADKTSVGEVYLNLGVVLGAGFNDKAGAMKYFVDALKLDRKLTISAARATPSIEVMFKAAQAQVGPEVPAANAFNHRVVDEAARGRPITIEATLHESLRAHEVVLSYRKSGSAASFVEARLLRQPRGLYVVKIPALAVNGRSIYYYVEARNAKGGRLAGSGEAESPNIIAVVDPSPRGGGFETPGGGGGGRGGTKSPSKEGLTLSIAVMGGTGVALVFGGESEHEHPRITNGVETRKKVGVAAGGALAPVHVAGEIAYHLDSDWQLAALVRVQLMTALVGENTKDSVSILGLLRAKRFFGSGVFRPLLSFGAGGGQIRHRVPLGDYDADPETDDDVVDARVAGIAALSFGGGFQLAFSRHVGFLFEVIGLFTVPDFSAHADINAGLVFSF